MGWTDVFDVASGRRIAELDSGTDEVVATAYSPDGRLLATSEENGATLRDATTHEVIARLGGHVDYVTGVAFTPDGEHLVTAGEDGTVMVRHLVLDPPRRLPPRRGTDHPRPAHHRTRRRHPTSLHRPPARAEATAEAEGVWCSTAST